MAPYEFKYETKESSPDSEFLFPLGLPSLQSSEGSSSTVSSSDSNNASPVASSAIHNWPKRREPPNTYTSHRGGGSSHKMNATTTMNPPASLLRISKEQQLLEKLLEDDDDDEDDDDENSIRQDDSTKKSSRSSTPSASLNYSAGAGAGFGAERITSSSSMDGNHHSHYNNDSTTSTSTSTGTTTDRTTRLKDVFSCARPINGYPTAVTGVMDYSSSLLVKNNMEGFLDGLVNGFWQCPGGMDMDDGSTATSTTFVSSTASSISGRGRQSCKNVLDALTESTQRMDFRFVSQQPQQQPQPQQSRPLKEQRFFSSSSYPNDTDAADEIPPLPSTSSSSYSPRKSSSSSAAAAKKAVGKMFKRIRVKRGENIGMELFEYAKSVYISRVAKDGTGLKRGMRIIAINDHPCPDSVQEAIALLSARTDHYEDYVTFVTGEEYDFENAPSVVNGAGEQDNHSTATTTTTGGDSYSIRSSTGYV